MHRKFIALVISAAVSVTALSAPARAADAEDVAGALFGIAALALIGKAISDHNKDDEVIAQPTHHKHHTHKKLHAHKEFHTHKKHVHPLKPRPLPPSVSRFDVPAHCLRDVTVNRRHVRLLGSGCLNRHYRHVHSLPRSCQFQFRDRHRSYTTYEPYCLRQHGYRITRR